MNVIKIYDREFELFYNTYAMQQIAEKCGGDIADLGKWLKSGKKTLDALIKVAEIVAILINGAVQKHNFEIELGLVKGELESLIAPDVIVKNISPNDIAKDEAIIFKTMSEGTDFKIPEGVDVDKEDEVDADLQAIRERNQSGKN